MFENVISDHNLYFSVLLPIVSILLCIVYMNCMVLPACKWLFMPFVVDA